MKYLVQVWAKNPSGREQHSYKFDFRDYGFMKSYEYVNTTVLVVKNESKTLRFV